MLGKANFDGTHLIQGEIDGAKQEGVMLGKANFESANLQKVLR
jgi:uncharacterized protein YjbI with pentapeptide repeats